MKNLFLFSTALLTALLSISRCGGSGLCQGECSPFVDPQQKTEEIRHVAFVSSLRTSGNLSGINGADTLCQQYAAEGEKTKSLGGTWRAVLSDSTTNSKDRIVLKSGSSVQNTNGDTVIKEGDMLWNGRLAAPIKYDQNGVEITEKPEVWSGTLSNGSRAAGPSLVTSCTNWNDGTTITNGGVIGTAGAVDQNWIEADDFIGCAKTDEKARLYCINSL